MGIMWLYRVFLSQGNTMEFSNDLFSSLRNVIKLDGESENKKRGKQKQKWEKERGEMEYKEIKR